MKNFKRILIILGVVVVVLTIVFFLFRSYTKSFSPEAKAQFKQKDFNIEVTYSRPSKKGRQIFGALIKFGKVWRTGANEATEISFNKDVTFGGKKVSAGSYTLFTIPEAGEWTFILNSELDQWGAFTYDEKKDVARVKIPVQELTSPIEMFTIDFKEMNQGAELQLKWDKTQVNLPIELQ